MGTERMMSLSELSQMLGIPMSTIYGWRYKGEGPTGYRLGKHARFRRRDVEAWLEKQADRTKLSA